jgi:predicted aspartyl protease
VKTFKQLSFLALEAIIVPIVPTLAAELHCPGNVAGLPFQLVNRSQIITPVMINHTGPYDFLVDTGTDITMIDPSLAAKLQLKSQGGGRVFALSSEMRASFSQLELIEVGPHAIANQEVVVRKLDYSLAADVHIRGILGANFLHRFNVLIDNAHKMLCLDGTRAMQIAMKGEHIALVTRTPPADREWSPALLLLAVHLPSIGSKPLLLQLDSGSNVPFLYDPAKYLLVGLSGTRLLGGQGLDGIVRTFVRLPTQEMRIGNLIFPGISFTSFLITNRDGFRGEKDGLLPTGLFRSVYIGYADRFVVLVPW